MLYNYFKIAFRNLARHKAYSAINILGLSLGVACCLLLTLYIQDELSYDKYHRGLDDLYRITTKFQRDTGLDRLATTSPPIGMVMGEEIPEVAYATRALNPPGVDVNLIKYEDKLFYEADGFIADSTLFEVLTYDLLVGNPKNALVESNSVVISDKLAKKLFGTETALDKSINISQGGAAGDYRITGVFRDNQKSHLHANFFTSMTSSGWAEYLRSPMAADEWAGQNFVPAYLRLHPGASREVVVQKMNELLNKYGADDMKALGSRKTLDLEPVKDIYLKSDIQNSPRIIYIYVIASIALFILLIACINFMNLSTAKATQRAPEIGVRKVMGAFRSSLIRQLMGEAMFIVIISMLISVIMLETVLPLFNEITGKDIHLTNENSLYFVLSLVGITLITGLLAGSYPAFYLASFEPAHVLKGKFSMSGSGGLLRKSLVVFQFMIAIVLVCGMLIISKQLTFMQEKNLGFNSAAKIVLPLRTREARSQYEALKHELGQNGRVQTLAGTEYIPGTRVLSDMMYYRDGGNMDNAVLLRRNNVDAGYMEMMGIDLVAGRKFTTNHKMDSAKLIVNEAGVKKLGFTPEEIIGQHLYFDFQGKTYTFEVVGVMKDYHQTSLKDHIEPLLFESPIDTDRYDFLVVSVAPQNFEETVASIEKTWKQLVNNTPFEYSFLDEGIKKQYDEDRKVAKIISSFTLIAMLISCLGLYGLSSYMAERRFKEIGVRKVMGASVVQIVRLMSFEFVKLVIIAFAIAVPLAWYAMNQWLQGFAFHIPLEVTVFLIAGFAALMIALLTVSFESLRAASVNPIKSLRSE